MLQNAPNCAISFFFLRPPTPPPPPPSGAWLCGMQLAQTPKKLPPPLANPAYARGLTDYRS